MRHRHEDLPEKHSIAVYMIPVPQINVGTTREILLTMAFFFFKVRNPTNRHSRLRNKPKRKTGSHTVEAVTSFESCST